MLMFGKKNRVQPIAELIPEIRPRAKSNPSKRKEGDNKMRADINEIKNGRIEKINESKTWFLEKIDKIDKRLIKKKERRHKLPISGVKERSLQVLQTLINEIIATNNSMHANLTIQKKWTNFSKTANHPIQS